MVAIESPRYQMMESYTCSNTFRSCEGYDVSILIGDSQGKLACMEHYERIVGFSFQKNSADKSGLQALAEVASTYAKLAEGAPLQTIIPRRDCQLNQSKIASKKRMSRSGHVKRLEPESPRLVEANSQVSKHFARVGWLNCIRKFQGYDIELTYHFILLSGNTVTVKGLSFRVTEDSTVEAIEVPSGGEAWFKNAAVTEVDMNKFVKPKHRNSSWSEGFPREYLTDEWNVVERLVYMPSHVKYCLI